MIRRRTRLFQEASNARDARFDPDRVVSARRSAKGVVLGEEEGYYRIRLNDDETVEEAWRGSVVYARVPRVQVTLESPTRNAIRAFRERMIQEANAGVPADERQAIPTAPEIYELTIDDVIELGNRAPVLPPEPE